MGKITNFSQNGECKGCIECCTVNLPLTKQEFKLMKSLLTKKMIDNIRKDISNGELYVICPFAIRGKGCSIYEQRPTICKIFHCDKNQIDIISAAISTREKRFTHNFINCFPKSISKKFRLAAQVLKEYEKEQEK